MLWLKVIFYPPLQSTSIVSTGLEIRARFAFYMCDSFNRSFKELWGWLVFSVSSAVAALCFVYSERALKATWLLLAAVRTIFGSRFSCSVLFHQNRLVEKREVWKIIFWSILLQSFPIIPRRVISIGIEAQLPPRDKMWDITLPLLIIDWVMKLMCRPWS